MEHPSPFQLQAPYYLFAPYSVFTPPAQKKKNLFFFYCALACRLTALLCWAIPASFSQQASLTPVLHSVGTAQLSLPAQGLRCVPASPS